MSEQIVEMVGPRDGTVLAKVNTFLRDMPAWRLVSSYPSDKVFYTGHDSDIRQEAHEVVYVLAGPA